jgi:hypothetical protein
MKNRLISFVMIFMLSASFAMAQRSDSPGMSFGVLGGVNFQNLNGKAFNGDKLNNDMLLGYHIGANVQIPIVPEFYFQPGILLSTAGAKNKSDASTSTTKLTYLQVPLDFVYKGALGSGFVMVGFGPYLGYGIAGKVITKGDAPTVEQKIVFKSTVTASDNDQVPYYKAFDAGANVFAGYQMGSGIFVQLDTQFGLSKINSKYEAFPEDKTSVKNTGFGLSLGYRF